MTILGLLSATTTILGYNKTVIPVQQEKKIIVEERVVIPETKGLSVPSEFQQSAEFGILDPLPGGIEPRPGSGGSNGPQIIDRDDRPRIGDPKEPDRPDSRPDRQRNPDRPKLDPERLPKGPLQGSEEPDPYEKDRPYF